ncbi:hypothetical protein [Actinomyces gaoshouyii]|uniref:Alpha/beta hydrolase n=1 Tax=Actinomyces gaoshouyii TaxID=1960083 RepID=A0A8H9H786_9ACTO|nr:hypothetical protein [Actinomyces gaoshouyii]GGO94937.1 hypothetical protein GCM10011612_01580 [Actinomyces gaoshouyii]
MTPMAASPLSAGPVLPPSPPSTPMGRAHHAEPSADPHPSPPPTQAPRPVPTAQARPAPTPMEPSSATPVTMGHSWAMTQGRPLVLVAGGSSISVSTADLDALAASLTAAAGQLDTAAAHVRSAKTDAEGAPVPADIIAQDPSNNMAIIAQTGSSLLPDADSSFVAGLVELPVAAFERKRDALISACDDLLTGAGSLSAASSVLTSLAADVSACSLMYTDAENGATVRADADVGARAHGPSQEALAAGAVIGSGLLLTAGVWLPTVVLVDILTAYGLMPDDAQVVLENLQLLLKSDITSEWAMSNLIGLACLGAWARKGETGREGATIQEFLRASASQLDARATAELPPEVQVGSRKVPTSSLTPMQRVAYALALESEKAGATRHGEPTALLIAPHNRRGATGTAVRVPPGPQDPFGLGSDIAAQDLTGSRIDSPPSTASELLDHARTIKGQARADGAGAISILRTDHADGTRSWVVVVPGTTEWTSGDTNPQDLQTNLQAVSGRPTDMEAAVVTAMRQSGIQPGEEVGIYGHSQGAMTAVNIASDPAVTENYTITSVLTAGGPTSGVALPDGTRALHLESTSDVVPGLDASTNPVTPNRATAYVDTRGGGAHSESVYADAVRGVESNEQAFADYSRDLSGLTGAGEQGATTTEVVFDVTREY